MLNKEQIIDFLKLFKFLNAADIIKISNLARFKSVKKGDYFISYQAKKRKIAYIQKGMFRAYFIRKDDEERTIFFRWEKHIIGSFETLLENKPSNIVIEALEDCKIWEIDYDILQDFIDRHPKFEKARKHMLQSLLLESLKRLETFVVDTPEERYKKLLIEKPEIYNRVQNKHIASFLGVTPVSLSRIRKRISN